MNKEEKKAKIYIDKGGKSYPNRRRFPRRKDGVKVLYMVPLKFSGVKWETHAEDIGAMGIRIKREEPFKEGTILALELELFFPEKKKEIIHAMARVVWCKKLEGDKEYSIGMEFILHDKEILKKISEFVNGVLDK